MIAPANTGRDRIKRVAVTIIDHVNNVIFAGVEGCVCLFDLVVRKLIAPKMDPAPARCREKILRSTAAPL